MVDQGSQICNNLMQKWLNDNYILMYLTHIEGKPVIAERFIKYLKGKIYKKITANNSKPYLSYLNKLVGKYNNTYQGYTENWSIEIFAINSMLKPNPWWYKIKDLNGEKTIGSFYEIDLLLKKL